MKSSFLQSILPLLLALVILAGGWLGIQSLDKILPSGMDGSQIHPLPEVDNDSISTTPSAPSLAPFTANGFPDNAQTLDAGLQKELVYMLFSSPIAESFQMIFSSDVQTTLIASDAGKSSYEVRRVPDGNNYWILYRIAVSSDNNLEIAIHSLEGLVLAQVVPVSASSARLYPDSTMLDTASKTCTSFLEYWKKMVDSPKEVKIRDSSSVSLSDGTTLCTDVHLPKSTDKPANIVLAGTQCRMEYAAEGGTAVVIYDFIGMRVTGIAFIPQ
jgi:hypothetical protein